MLVEAQTVHFILFFNSSTRHFLWNMWSHSKRTEGDPPLQMLQEDVLILFSIFDWSSPFIFLSLPSKYRIPYPQTKCNSTWWEKGQRNTQSGDKNWQKNNSNVSALILTLCDRVYILRIGPRIKTTSLSASIPVCLSNIFPWIARIKDQIRTLGPCAIFEKPVRACAAIVLNIKDTISHPIHCLATENWGQSERYHQYPHQFTHIFYL